MSSCWCPAAGCQTPNKSRSPPTNWTPNTSNWETTPNNNSFERSREPKKRRHQNEKLRLYACANKQTFVRRRDCLPAHRLRVRFATGIDTFSEYTPGQTMIVSPVDDAVTAAWMVVYIALVPQPVPGAREAARLSTQRVVPANACPAKSTDNATITIERKLLFDAARIRCRHRCNGHVHCRGHAGIALTPRCRDAGYPT